MRNVYQDNPDLCVGMSEKGMTMHRISERIKEFFEDFDRANNTFDPNLLASYLSDPILAAEPNGGSLALKKDDYLAGIVERQAYLHTLGFQFVKTVPLEETPLGHHYML